MEQSFYIFDGNKVQWVESKAPWVQEDIEKFNLSFVSRDMTAEQVQEKADDKPYHLLAYVDASDFSERYNQIYKNACARWRVQLYKPQKTAIILVDVYTVSANYQGISLHTRGSKQYSLRLDYGKWQYIAIPSQTDRLEFGGNGFSYKYDWTDKGFDFSVDIPQVVVDKVMGFLMELSREEFGFVPTVPENMPPGKLLKYFIQYPLDVSVGWYVELLGYDFSRQVLRTNDSNFQIICDYLQLPATKALQRAYRQYGRILIICFFLQKIGLTDTNLWPLFYDMDIFMGNDLSKWGIDRSGHFYLKNGGRKTLWWGSINDYAIRNWWSQEENDTTGYDSQYVGWQLLYEWLHDKWNPQRVAEILRGAMETNSYIVSDCLNMWFHDYTEDDFRDDFVQSIYRTGFSRDTHDIWMDARRRIDNEQRRREANAKHKDFMNIEFTLTKGDLMKEEDTPYGSFKVARSGSELFQLSERFHNCVFYLYTEKMNRRECTIYYLESNGKLVACIEVAGGVIRQALGDHNNILTGEILDAVKDWGIRHNLEFKPIM